MSALTFTLLRGERRLQLLPARCSCSVCCQALYESFNAREVRRQAVAAYAAHALAETLRMCRDGLQPYSLAWQVSAVPDDRVLRHMLLKGLTPHLLDVCRSFQQKQLLRNSKGIRLDGNFDLAKIIRVPDGGEAFTAVLGVCGLDGSLLVPFIPLTRESLTTIQAVPTQTRANTQTLIWTQAHGRRQGDADRVMLTASVLWEAVD